MKDSDLTATQANGKKMELSGMFKLLIETGGFKTLLKLEFAPDWDRTRILDAEGLKKNLVAINFESIEV